MIDYSTLVGFTDPIILTAIICYTLVQIVKLIVERKKDKIEKPHDKQETP